MISRRLIILYSLLMLILVVLFWPQKAQLPEEIIISPERDDNGFGKRETQEEVSLSSGYIFKAPLENSEKRVTKKAFGQFVSPENSPVQPERFSGYHTGVDLEVFEDEFDSEIEVKAICEGNIIFKDFVNGYGGVLIQSCGVNDILVTVLYGHLDLDSISLNNDDLLKPEQTFAYLGDDKSKETDGERKHLHLAIHRGDDLEFKGYVQSEQELEEWLDPCNYFSCN